MPLAILDDDLCLARKLIAPFGPLLEAAIARAVAEERERCAIVAEHLNGWGDPPAPQLARHIAMVIRDGP